jgi:hypothetical protein
MENINEKIELIGDINVLKKDIINCSPEEIFNNCPIITIPVNTLLFHSNIFDCDTMIANSIYPLLNHRYYAPKIFGEIECRVCRAKEEHHIFPGEKPRSSEYIMNNNIYNKSVCACKKKATRAKRLFGNFNFIGNYWLDLENPMRGTQVFLTIHPMRFLDISSISVELGFSLKRFIYSNEQNVLSTHSSEFAITEIYTKYCKQNNLDGLLLIDYTDRQNIIDAEENQKKSAEVSCFKCNIDGNITTVCPEFTILHETRPVDYKNPVGTDKMINLGKINLFDEHNNKLSRNQVEISINFLLNNYLNRIKEIQKNENIIINIESRYFYKIIEIIVDETITEPEYVMRSMFDAAISFKEECIIMKDLIIVEIFKLPREQINISNINDLILFISKFENVNSFIKWNDDNFFYKKLNGEIHKYEKLDINIFENDNSQYNHLKLLNDISARMDVYTLLNTKNNVNIFHFTENYIWSEKSMLNPKYIMTNISDSLLYYIINKKYNLIDTYGNFGYLLSNLKKYSSFKDRIVDIDSMRDNEKNIITDIISNIHDEINNQVIMRNISNLFFYHKYILIKNELNNIAELFGFEKINEENDEEYNLLINNFFKNNIQLINDIFMFIIKSSNLRLAYKISVNPENIFDNSLGVIIYTSPKSNEDTETYNFYIDKIIGECGESIKNTLFFLSLLNYYNKSHNYICTFNNEALEIVLTHNEELIRNTFTEKIQHILYDIFLYKYNDLLKNFLVNYFNENIDNFIKIHNRNFYQVLINYYRFTLGILHTDNTFLGEEIVVFVINSFLKIFLPESIKFKLNKDNMLEYLKQVIILNPETHIFELIHNHIDILHEFINRNINIICENLDFDIKIILYFFKILYDNNKVFFIERYNFILKLYDEINTKEELDHNDFINLIRKTLLIAEQRTSEHFIDNNINDLIVNYINEIDTKEAAGKAEEEEEEEEAEEMSGGNIYRNKYLKYKSKYLELKNKLKK